MEQKKDKKISKKFFVIFGILISFVIIGIVIPSTKLYAETINGGTALQIANEKTLLRMTSSLARASATDRKIDINTLGTLLDNYSGSGATTVTNPSTNILKVTFAATGNIYEINVNKGPILDLSYIVTYNANGGKGAPTPQTKESGETITLSTTVPTRTGYVFKGWATSSTATTAEYAPGAQYALDDHIILYAVWELEVDAYTITYNANGGTGAPAQQIKIIGETLTLSTTIPTRSDHIFKGWATSSTATIPNYEAGGTYTNDESITLYAVWEAQIITYTVTYNANGGSGAPAAQTKNAGETLTLSTTIPTRTGYAFLGWSTSSTATTAEYEVGGAYTEDADVTLYAVWSNKVNLTLNSNGGIFKSGLDTISVTASVGESVTLPTDENIEAGFVTRTGYTFFGWSESATATSATYSSGAAVIMNNNKTLYAVWVETSNVKNVTLYANNGIFYGSSEYYISQTVAKGETVTIPMDTSSIPRRTGYNFLGYSPVYDATVAVYEPGDTILVESDIVLYAVWKSTGATSTSATMTLITNGGTFPSGVEVRQNSTTKGNTVNIPSTAAFIPTRTGYTFKGWALSAMNPDEIYQPGRSFTMTEDMTFYAIWQANE